MRKIKTAIKKDFFVFGIIPGIVILLAIAFLVRIILSPFGTLTLDQNTFISWGNTLSTLGLGKFYFSTWSDYLPGYLYLLSVLGQIGKLNIISPNLLYKLPGILSDLGTGYIIYRIVWKLKDKESLHGFAGKRWGLISAAIYLFNPAILANSTFWGQVDGLTAFFSLLTIWSYDFNPYLSAASLAVGTLVKPQMAVISLIILLMMIRDRWNIKKIVPYVLGSFLIFIVGFIPFSNNTNLINFIVSRLNVSLNQYPYTSVNAFNFWAIVGTWRVDTGLNLIGAILALVLFFAFGIKFLKQKGGQYVLLSFAFALSFLFMTRMHERHLLPVFAPLTIAAALNPVFIFALVGFSFIYVLNLVWAWNWVTNGFNEIFGGSAVKILSFINVFLVAIFIFPKRIVENDSVKKILSFKFNLNKKEDTNKNVFVLEKVKISSNKIKILFILVVIFASVARFYNLNEPTTHYFDEVYHAFTAQNMLHGVTKAWEWWNPNPEGFAYEWTHPPVAKEGMVLGMLLLGENSFGWRFPGAILGVGSVILVYFIAKEIFDDELVGLIAAAAVSLDGLLLVMSRIGMNDSYMLFFALASVYSYLKKRNFWSAIFFGLSLSSKWSALWIAPIIFVAHFVFKRKFKWSYIFFFILPPIIYISTYFPLFTNKEIQSEYVANTGYALRTDKIGIIPLDMFVDTQKQMWWYHTNLRATHPYSSLWYTWPFLVRPIYLYTSNEVDGTVSRIYDMGNPIVFWFGILSVFVMGGLAFREKDKKLGFVVFSYLVFFTPWALSPRIMFLYHYVPSIPFMAIAIAYILRRYKQFLFMFLIFAVVAFIYFYPHWAGLKIPLALDTSYYWFPSWR